MPLLSLRVAHHADESPAGYVSRLAKINGRASSRVLASDLGLDLRAVSNGSSSALRQLSQMSGASFESLCAEAIVQDDGGYELRGERLQRSSLRREIALACPACLQRDLESGGKDAPYQRTEWQVDHIRSCGEHEIELIEFDSTHDRFDMNDFAFKVMPHLRKLGDMTGAATRTGASRFEAYIRGRLRKVGSVSHWLDSLELHAAARVTEVIGAVVLKGIWPGLKHFGIQDWRKAADLGFDVTADGKEGVRAFLAGLQTARGSAASGHDGPQATMGMLFDWASRGTKSAAYDPVRDVFFQHIVETTPVKQGEVILGRAVERRALHTVRSAEVEFGAHPKRLAKILEAQTANAGTGDAGLKVFDADTARTLLRKLRDSISLLEAREHLGADRVHIKLLYDNGFITSLVHTGGRLAFERSALDRFLAELLRGAEVISSVPDGMAQIPRAAKIANCSAAEIVRLILGRKLEWTGQLAGEHGYSSVVVDVEEVKSHVRGASLDALPARFIIKELKTNYKVVDALIQHGQLKSETAINPVNRCPVVVVRRADLDEFVATYGTLFQIAAERGCHPRTLKAQLDAHGVKPAFPPDVFHATFYRRAEIAA